MADQQVLRRRLKQARAQIDDVTRARTELRILRRVARDRRYLKARRVAAYIGRLGEVDPMPLLRVACEQHKDCYLPVLHPFRGGHLWFCRWRPGDPLRPNRFGIPEPVPNGSNLIPARRLDLVLVPLLGFDTACHRLGMGGGFYDRSFAFVQRLRHARRPALLGLAHDVQRVDALPVRPWDVQLDAVMTERTTYCSHPVGTVIPTART